MMRTEVNWLPQTPPLHVEITVFPISCAIVATRLLVVGSQATSRAMLITKSSLLIKYPTVSSHSHYFQLS